MERSLCTDSLGNACGGCPVSSGDRRRKGIASERAVFRGRKAHSSDIDRKTAVQLADNRPPARFRLVRTVGGRRCETQQLTPCRYRHNLSRCCEKRVGVQAVGRGIIVASGFRGWLCPPFRCELQRGSIRGRRSTPVPAGSRASGLPSLRVEAPVLLVRMGRWGAPRHWRR